MANGTEGRLELEVEEPYYVSGGAGGPGRGDAKTNLVLRRHSEKPQVIRTLWERMTPATPAGTSAC